MAARPFRPANELMVQYAGYHRDQRNIATHFIGVPLVVLAIGVLLARVDLGITSLAWVAWAGTTAWHLTRGNLALGAATSAVTGVIVALAHPLAGGGWLGWSLALFALGWLIQFVGHYYEGRRPSFTDDLAGLPVGPMFIVGEALFAAGWGRELLAEIERRAGPTHLRDLAHPVS